MLALDHRGSVTAKQIIHAIESLPPQEQAKVISFARGLDPERQLSPLELGALAERFVAATDPEQVKALREELTRGFYGQKPSAKGP